MLRCSPVFHYSNAFHYCSAYSFSRSVAHQIQSEREYDKPNTYLGTDSARYCAAASKKFTLDLLKQDFFQAKQALRQGLVLVLGTELSLPVTFNGNTPERNITISPVEFKVGQDEE